ncbi:MAG: hypothetical protein H0W64_01920 [Gammaproteobacteria bacterium]|nr:hypothetical protein [Gammaproteobacteria bacterium]
MVIASSLLGATFAYIAPAMADDENDEMGQSMIMASNDSKTTNNIGDLAENNASDPNDAGAPDTATGDDDY